MDRQLLSINSTLNYNEFLWTQEYTSQIAGMTVQLPSSTASSHKILNPEHHILRAAKIKLTTDANKLVHDIKTGITSYTVHNLKQLRAYLIKYKYSPYMPSGH
jgi:hypothetical protein